MKTAVLIHGCHLKAEDWESIVWGDPQNGVFGRAPKGMQIALDNKAELICWGTGASEKDGKKEAAYTFDYAVAHGNEIPRFSGYDPYEVEGLLRPFSNIDVESLNTKEEIMVAGALCQECGINRLILVSSPTHIARCLQEALKLKASGELVDVEIFATASDTCYSGTTPSDVVIAEPPHRGDRPKVPIHKTLKRANSLGRKPGGIAEGFHRALKKLIEKWEDEVPF